MRGARQVCLVAIIALAACGRTPEARTAYPCTVDLTAACDVLASQRENLIAAYQQEITKPAPDPVRADDIGACSRTLLEQELTLRCFADACEPLCAMHPCPLDDDTQACAEGCDAIVVDKKIAVGALEDALLSAAERPGLCTCDVCAGGTDALCKDLWVCP